MKKEFLIGVWTLVGVTVGAGIFGLPYVFYKAGFYTGLAVITFTSLIMILLSLYLGEIILRTKENHQLSGLAEKYLGKKGKTIMFIVQLLSIYGALAAYIIGSGLALSSIFGGSSRLYSILFFIVLSPVIYFTINIMEKFEYVFTPIKIIISGVLSFLLIRFIDFSNFTGFSFSKLLIPYGVAIFAFTGMSALPEINEGLKNKSYMLKIILFGNILTFMVYLFFVIAVIGSVGNVDQVATVSLSELGSGINIFANLFALFAMGTAFVVLGFAMKENLTLDYKINNSYSWAVTIIIPILLALTGFFGFVELLELVGAVAIGIMLFMIILMHSKAKKLGDRKPEYNVTNNWLIKILLILFLFIGVFYTVFIG